MNFEEKINYLRKKYNYLLIDQIVQLINICEKEGKSVEEIELINYKLNK